MLRLCICTAPVVFVSAAPMTPGPRFRVIAVEMPGFGQSDENTRTRTIAELAATMVKAADALGLDRFDLMGTSFGGKAALWLAIQDPERVRALVLEAPAAIRPPGAAPPSGTPEQMAARLYAHPERMPPLPAPDPSCRRKQRALVTRLRGPDRDPELEAAMRRLDTPSLVLFGTLDRVIPSEMGRHYKGCCRTATSCWSTMPGTRSAPSARRPSPRS